LVVGLLIGQCGQLGAEPPTAAMDTWVLWPLGSHPYKRNGRGFCRKQISTWHNVFLWSGSNSFSLSVGSDLKVAMILLQLNNYLTLLGIHFVTNSMNKLATSFFGKILCSISGEGPGRNSRRRLLGAGFGGLGFAASGPLWAALGAAVTLSSGQPANIYPGQNSEIEITLSNSNTASPISAVQFSNSLPGVLPNGLKVAGAATYFCTDPSSSSNPIAGSGTLTATLGTQLISLNGGVIPTKFGSIDGTCTIRVPVTAGTSTGSARTDTYSLGSSTVTGNDGIAVANAGSVSQSLNILAFSRPLITKNLGSTTLTLGGAATTLSITVSNPNPVPLANVNVSDIFPALANPQAGGASQGVIKVANPPNASYVCAGGNDGVITPAAGDTTISAAGGTIAANGSCTISVQVEANHTNGLYSINPTNTINATTQFANDVGIPASANATRAFTVRSPLAVTKTVNNGSLATGQAGFFTITLTNNGLVPLTASLTDDPIDGVAPAGAGHPAYGLAVTGASTTCAGGSAAATTNNTGVALSGGTVPAGGSCTVTVNFIGAVQTPNTPSAYTNSLAAGAVDVGNPAIVSQSRSASVTVYDNLSVSKSASPATASPGNPVRYQVTVNNWSNTSISNVAVSDTLANSQSFLTGTINGIDYTPTVSGSCGLSVSGATGAVTPVFTIGTVPARVNVNTPGSCTVTFWSMTSTAAGNGATFTNTLGAGSVCYDPGTGNICNGAGSNAASGTITSTVLSAAKSFSHGGVTNPGGVLSRPEGTIIRMSITLSNHSANALVAVALSDTLPTSGATQMQVANPANAVSSCGGTLTAAPGSTSVSLNGATVPARAGSGTGADGSCVIQLDVVGPAGTYNNTATATATETYANGTTHTINATSNSASVTYTSSLSAIKVFNPASVASGGKSTVTVRLNNAGAAALTAVGLTDPLPSGMLLANPPNAYSTCDGGPSITATAGASSVAMSGASIAGSGSCDFIFDVIATGAANWVNTIPVGGIRAAGGIINQSTVTGTLTYTAPNNPTVAKATNPSTLTFPGQVSQLILTVTNGTQAVSNLRLSDYFTTDGTVGAAANGMVVAPTPGASTTCPGGLVSAAAGATSVTLSGVSLAAGASCTLSVNVTSTAVGGVTNYIPVGAIQSDQGLSNTGQASTSLTTQSSMGVVKQFTPGVVKPGERSRLRITFYNPVGQPMSNISVTDNLPTGVTIPAGPNSSSNCVGATVSAPAPGQVQVTGGSLPGASGSVAASCFAEIDVLVATPGDYVNTIPTGGATAIVGGVAVSSALPTSSTLRAKSPLVVHKAIANLTLDAGNPAPFTTGAASGTPGASAVLTIRLENPNGANLTAASFTDTLPSGLVVATTPNASTTCASGTVSAVASGTSIRLTGATIPANGNCNVSVNVLSNISGTYTNTIPAAAVTTFEGVSNEEASSAKIVIATPPTVSKQFSPGVIAPNGVSTLTIVFGNGNSSALTLSSVFADTLPTVPGPITVAPTPNVVKTCPGSVTATAGAASISYAAGATIPTGGCSISVDVTGTTSGNHTNNIPAGALATNLGSNQLAANAVLGVSTLGYISGRVFKDNNLVPNGTYEAGIDLPISGGSIELRSGANCSGALLGLSGLTNPATTDALGNYMFTGLPAGTYSVCQPVQPAGTVNGTSTAGTITSVNGSTGSAGIASNPSASSSQIAGVVLNAAGGGEVSGSANNNFAELVLSSISGTVFLDQNNNGVQNGSDSGIAGVSVELHSGANCSGGLLGTTTTIADGSYSFGNLQPGTYTVCEPNQPAGTSNGVTTAGSVGNGGSAGSPTAVSVLPSAIQGVVLPPNTPVTSNNFAEIPNGRTLSGRVFLDYNNNGTLDGASDHGLGGQTVNLTGSDLNANSVSRSATTVADGSYNFAALPEGTYTVTQPNQPPGTTNGITSAGSSGGTATAVTVLPSTISGINLTGSNTVSGNNNFAEIPGAAPDLSITKAHSPSSFGDASSTGYFTITPLNIGLQPTSGVITIVDTLPAGMTVAAPASGPGWTCSGAAGATTVSCISTSLIAANSNGNPIILRVAVDSGRSGQILTNTAVISGGGEPSGFDGNNTATDPVAISTTARISGSVWMDSNHDRRMDSGETRLVGWIVELLLGNGSGETLVATTTTNASGAYSFTGVAPGSGYRIRFRQPTTGAIWGRAVPNEQGLTPVSGARDTGPSTVNGGVVTAGNPAGAVLTGDGTLANLTLLAGDNIVEQSLPLDPSGVVYDAVTRLPVAGAVVTIAGPGGFNPAIHLVGGSAAVTTGSDGLYQFLLVSGAPDGVYTLAVTTYPPGYLQQPSTMVPGCTNVLNVGAAPNPALVQPQANAPLGSVALHDPAACPSSTLGFPVGNTQYFYRFNFTNSLSAGLLNNHIPIDPIIAGAIVMSKTTPLINVHRGDLVPYTVTATNRLSAALTNINVADRIPPGFRYRVGSASLNGLPIEPVVVGRDLTWKNLTFSGGEKKTFKLILVVGSGVGEGEYTNQAWSLNNLINSSVSNIAGATVRVVPDPTFDCSDLIGKVFDDRNANGYQDEGEQGISNVRVVTARGLLVTTDAEGRFHVACADIPQVDHGSNFVMKLDERTLPSGYRLTTENPRDVRLSRGKMTKLNFGATVHRVVRLELTPAAFGTGNQLSSKWESRLPEVLAQLKGRPSILRIAYAGDAAQGKDRLKAVAERFRQLWKEGADSPGKDAYPLIIETELEGTK
jgi:uncharacterized repeat protein (TIGR01451 family)